MEDVIYKIFLKEIIPKQNPEGMIWAKRNMWVLEENHTQRPVYSLVGSEEDGFWVGDREMSPECRVESSREGSRPSS